MSTRSNIIITKKGTNDVWQYYHHCDGYLSGVGEDLRMFIRVAEYIHKICSEKGSYHGNGIDCLGWVMKGMAGDDYEPEPENGESENINTLDKLHRDIEYLYLIQESDKELEFYFMSRHYGPSTLFKDLLNDKPKKPYKDVIADIVENGIRLPIEIDDERYTDDFEQYLIDREYGTKHSDDEDFEPVELMTLSTNEVTCETQGELNSALAAFGQVLDFIKWFGNDHTDNETLKAMKMAIIEDMEEYGD